MIYLPLENGINVSGERKRVEGFGESRVVAQIEVQDDGSPLAAQRYWQRLIAALVADYSSNVTYSSSNVRVMSE